MDLKLVDRIYECSFVPELWPGVLGDLAEIATARVGCLFISKREIQHWACSTEAESNAMKPHVENGSLVRTDRFARFTAAHPSGFLTEADVYTPEEHGMDFCYQKFLFPRGLGWSASTTFPLPFGYQISVILERDYDRGPVETDAIMTLDALRPHLARGALMSARLQLERARAVSEALGLIGLAALVLDEKGKVLAANPLIEAMTGDVQWRANDRLSLTDKRADQLLRDAIAELDVPSGAAVRSFPVRAPGKTAMMVAHVVPVRLSARDIFIRCAAVLVLAPVTQPQAPPIELVQSLFDLTPAEARVAKGLAGGKTVDDLALHSGVSSNTVRAHVRGVLEKMGCHRQADVVALLTRISSTRPIDSV